MLPLQGFSGSSKLDGWMDGWSVLWEYWPRWKPSPRMIILNPEHLTLHHAASVGAGKGSKTTIHFCYGTFVSFQGRRRVYSGPQHAPTFFCPATLYDSLFWEAQVGTWDTKLTKHSLSLQWGQLVPWECRWPCNATRWTTLRHISWQSAKRGISCLHNFIFTGGGKKHQAISKCETAAGAGSNSDYWTCLKSEPLWWTLLQIRVFPWLLPNACWE